MSQRNIPRNILTSLLKSAMKRYDESNEVVIEGKYEKETYRIIARQQKNHFILVTIYRIS